MIEVRINPWGTISDKTQVQGVAARLHIFSKLLLAYPVLFVRYLRQPQHDLVVMMHAGLFDVLLLGWLVKLRRKPLVWDIYISWFDTLVNDRKLFKADSLRARLLYFLEKTAAHIANTKFLDTREHADYFETLYSLPKRSLGVVHVGVDSEFLQILKQKKDSYPSGGNDKLRLLYYGNFIPLHGVNTIVEAVALLKNSGKELELTLVGDGQMASAITKLISDLGLVNVTRIPWLTYSELVSEILGSDICMGIFGTSGKAQRVIPNKIYQIAAAEVPFITGETPALREFCELAGQNLPCEWVQLGDAEALAKAILKLYERSERGIDKGFAFDVDDVREEFTTLLLEALP
ncbi:glycosyltransferase [Kiritimatiellota bacterium B12222]|nr:glycosyltransferase [Kiritimatiellota bacterium B12222]